MKRIQMMITLVACLMLAACATSRDGMKTVINDRDAAKRLMGDHEFALQWISWDDFGVASVRDEGGLWHITGRQDSKEHDDFITMDGTITQVDRYEFLFDGVIVTRIHHIADGETVTREGVKTFRMNRNRPYWRMVEMNNPADSVVDYVDVFVRRPR